MAGPYNAGTVFLQVVPSFQDVQKAARQAAREYVDAFGKEYDKAISGEMETGAKKAAKSIIDESRKAGEKGGEQAGGALADGIQKRLKAAIKALPNIKVTADTSDAETKVALFRKGLEAIRDAHLKLDLDDQGAMREIVEISTMMRDLNGQTADFSVRGNTSVALTELKAVEEVARQLDGEAASVNVEADGAGAAVAGLNSVSRAARQLDGKKATVKVDVDGGAKATGLLAALRGQMNRTGANTDVAGGALRAFNGYVLMFTSIGPAAIPVLAGLSGGLAALAVNASGAASGLGVLILGLSGIGDAVSAMGDVADDAAKDSLSMGRSMRLAARGVRDAQIQLARARVRASEQIADAARRVSGAEQQAARQIESATRAAADAERRLADAQRDAKDAQEDLVEARVEAARQLEDLQNRNKEGALAERQAVVDLFQATVHYRNTMADPGATNLEQEQAAIAYERAKLRLSELRTENKRNQSEEKKRVREGIDGSEVVQSAQERVTEALRAQADAQRDLGEATRAVDRARIDGARAVEDALRDQARTQRDAAQSVADAQRAVSDAQATYQERLTQTGEIGSASMDKLNTAMGKLGPTQRRFARFLFSLRPEFYRLREVAAAGFLPSLQTGMQEIIDVYGPSFTRFIGEISNVVGDLFDKSTALFTTQGWQDIFSTFGKFAPEFLGQTGDFVLNMMTVFGELGAAFAPLAKDFGEAAVAFSQQLVAWVQEWTKSEGFKEFLDYLREQGPRIQELIMALLGAIVNLAVALAPYADQILNLLIGFLNWIADMDPKTLGALATGILVLVTAFQLLAGGVGLVANVIFVIGLIGGVAAAVILGIVLLGAALVWLWFKSETFRDIVTGVWDAVWGAISFVVDWLKEKAWPVIKTIFDAIGAAASWLWRNFLKPIFSLALWQWNLMVAGFDFAWRVILKPLFQFLASAIVVAWKISSIPIKALLALFKWMAKGMVWVWDHWLKPLFVILGAIWEEHVQPKVDAGVKAVGDAWAKLKDFAKEPIKWMVETVLNKGLIAGWNKIAEALDAPTIDPIELPRSFYSSSVVARNRAGRWGNSPGFASGGIYPGYTPGRDVGYAAVSGGEAIMRPEWTRVVGADYVHQMNRLAREGGVDAIRRFLGGFASGGIVSWRGHRFTEAMVKRMQLAERLVRATFHITQGGFRPATSYSGTSHRGDAVDISSPIANAVVAALRRSGIAAWHRTPAQGPWGHHIHGVPLPGGGVRPLGSAIWQAQDYLRGGDGLGGRDDFAGGVVGVLKGAGGWLVNALSSPVKWLRDRIAGPMKKLGDHPFAQLIKAVPTKLIDFMADRIGDTFGFLGIGGDDENDDVNVYDNGGWLPPGVSTVMNMTGRPEPVLTPDQWDRIQTGQGFSATIYTQQGATADQIADAFNFAYRRLRRGGAYTLEGVS